MGSITFKLNLGEVVHLKELDVKGRIIGYYFGETGIQYNVSYWYDGQRKTTYVFPGDIARLEDSKMGFKGM